MTFHPWTEETLSEEPAIDLLVRLGWSYVPPAELDDERESPRDPILLERLEAALWRLNPWLSDDNLHRAVRAITNVQAASLLEANEAVHTAIARTASVEQDRGGGRKSWDVHYIDFADPDANDWVVTNQFRVRGAKKTPVPDLVLFANGLPLAVIECKSPGLGDAWRREGIDQLHRYQELGEAYQGIGAPRLFHAVQLVAATCGQAAVYGTVGTSERSFAEWKKPYPWTIEQLADWLGRTPTPQDILIQGLFARERLLDLVQSFVVFEREVSTGRLVKKVPRYQQLRAVDKAVARAATAGPAEERGGVVWHTQGSGKSLTMLWLALKLRRDPTHENPTLVIVTDRIALDEQITGTFRACGFPNPERAESVADLRRLLTGAPGATILTTVQKFREVGEGKHPVLSEAPNVFVLTDEAHRSQYGSLAANLRRALPNAVFFGFTGTPIDKADRSTLRTFGTYIDTYTIEQAVEDGATVPIFYEGRLAELALAGRSLDQVFDRVFADRTPEEREVIKSRYATEGAIAEAPKRIETICLDLIEHFTRVIQPNGFKAQVVTRSRRAAVLYKETLDRLHGPPSVVIVSGSNDDKADLVRHHTTSLEQQRLVERFLKRDDPLAMLIVCDMLLTGFDAPVEQVMYLDAPLREHTLLQAIARVNRTAEGKTYGLVVDYWGVSEQLQEALAIFAPVDVQGALTPKTDELPRLAARHAAAMRFFARVTDRDDLDRLIAVLEPEDVRAAFQEAFRRFAQSMDMLLPDPRAMDYAPDLKWLGTIRQAARARFRDPGLDIRDCGAKVRKLIDEAIAAQGIEILVQPVSLVSPELEAKLAALRTEEAKASEMEHAIKAEIHVRLDEDPVYYESLRERLERIIEDGKARRISAAQQLELYDELARETRQRVARAEALGLSELGLSIYHLLAAGPPDGSGEVRDVNAAVWAGQIDEPTRELATLVEDAVLPHTRIVDWTRKEDVQREMRRQVKRQLKAARWPAESIDLIAATVLERLRAVRGR